MFMANLYYRAIVRSLCLVPVPPRTGREVLIELEYFSDNLRPRQTARRS
jgi:hypothetical protein